ncbi:MAG TPA: hypothetical protein VMG14_08210 [Thermoplasmata archaeon]|nr:hypothetical protein [Thermoplasmata archaeon]
MMASEEDRGERDASGRPTGQLPRRESVADGTRRYIDARPSVRDSLLYDIVNFTALARRIRRETNLGSQEAIEIACRRYRRQMENEESREEQLRNVVRQSHVELRTHVASLTIRGDLEFLSRLGASLERSVPPRARILQLFEGSGSVTILCDENFLPSLLAAVPRDSVISVRRRLSIVSIRSPEEVIVTPRILSFLADAFGRWGINCEEMTSVYTDTHFALKASDALRAFEILSELTRAAAGPSAELPETEGRARSPAPAPARSAAGARAAKRGRR